MDLKKIFREGINEFKRRVALQKEKRQLHKKEILYSRQLTDLGKKAWESQMDITVYGNIKELIDNTQKQQVELKNQLEELEKQKQDNEETIKQKNNAFDSRRKEVEEKKREVDSRLSEEKRVLKDAQKEYSNSSNRLNHIAKEEERLKKKSADTETPDAEREEIQNTLGAFVEEKELLHNKITEIERTIKLTNEKIIPIEDESRKLQKEIDEIRAEQKDVIGELEKSLSEIKRKINECNNNVQEIDKTQDDQFEQLGEKLAAAGISNESVNNELTIVKSTEIEIAEVKSKIETLEHKATPDTRRAFWIMIGFILGSVIVIVAIIILLSTLFGKSDKTTDIKNITSTPPTVSKLKESVPSQVADTIEKYKQRIAEISNEEKNDPDDSPISMEDAMKKMVEATGEIKKKSEQIQGGKIVVSDKAALMAALPVMNDWVMEEPDYQKGRFAQLETSHISTIYTRPGANKIYVRITDTASAAAALQTWRIIFQMALSREDDRGYQKITTVNDIPMIERFDKQNQQVSLHFIVKDRYLLELESQGKDSSSILKNFIPEFHLEKLH